MSELFTISCLPSFSASWVSVLNFWKHNNLLRWNSKCRDIILVTCTSLLQNNCFLSLPSLVWPCGIIFVYPLLKVEVFLLSETISLKLIDSLHLKQQHPLVCFSSYCSLTGTPVLTIVFLMLMLCFVFLCSYPNNFECWTRNTKNKFQPTHM